MFLLLAGLSGPGARAQDTAASPHDTGASPQGKAPLPEFEVATIKPSNMSGTGVMGLYTYPGGRIHAGYSPLRRLIEYAFDLQTYQIEGGPSWIGQDFYDVDAIPPESSKARQLKPAGANAPPSGEQRQMLQALLIQRFGLQYHLETREGRVYWMVRNGKQLKLSPAKDPTLVPFMNVNVYHGGVGNGEMVGQNTSMAWMALRLSQILRLPVLDKTGIAGSFDFDVPAPEAANADRTNAALEGLETLGLKLQAARGAVTMLVVDHAERPGSN